MITAFEESDVNSFIEQNVAFIVNDINDQVPTIILTQDNKQVESLDFKICEGIKSSNSLNNITFSIDVEDKDVVSNQTIF